MTTTPTAPTTSPTMIEADLWHKACEEWIRTNTGELDAYDQIEPGSISITMSVDTDTCWCGCGDTAGDASPTLNIRWKTIGGRLSRSWNVDDSGKTADDVIRELIASAVRLASSQ